MLHITNHIAISTPKGCFVCKLFAQTKSSYEVSLHNCLIFKWAHLGMIQGPPDYESGALTN
jgi:hypothetical protein